MHCRVCYVPCFAWSCRESPFRLLCTTTTSHARPLLFALQALGRRVRGCVWSLQELPASPALAALRLWGAMLDCEDVRAGAQMDWVGFCAAGARHGMAWRKLRTHTVQQRFVGGPLVPPVNRASKALPPLCSLAGQWRLDAAAGGTAGGAAA